MKFAHIQDMGTKFECPILIGVLLKRQKTILSVIKMKCTLVPLGADPL